MKLTNRKRIAGVMHHGKEIVCALIFGIRQQDKITNRTSFVTLLVMIVTNESRSER